MQVSLNKSINLLLLGHLQYDGKHCQCKSANAGQTSKNDIHLLPFAYYIFYIYIIKFSLLCRSTLL